MGWDGCHRSCSSCRPTSTIRACIISRCATPGSAFVLPTGADLGLALAPLFMLSLAGRAPPMFGFEPYFVHGCALYFALNGAGRIAWGIAIVACAGMAAHFLGQH